MFFGEWNRSLKSFAIEGILIIKLTDCFFSSHVVDGEWRNERIVIEKTANPKIVLLV
jgi:hypothetical protein